jgi:hypothetical protein
LGGTKSGTRTAELVILQVAGGHDANCVSQTKLDSPCFTVPCVLHQHFAYFLELLHAAHLEENSPHFLARLIVLKAHDGVSQRLSQWDNL